METASKFSINIRGQLFYFDQAKIMGILNLTPDSFYDGGQLKSDAELLSKAEKLLEEGADFLDVGGYSSRPGAKEISQEEELLRTAPGIEIIMKEFPNAIISIDTFRASVAKRAVEAGASLINDISAGDDDPAMFSTLKELQVPYIMMHKQGKPANMQQNPTYEDVSREVLFYLSKKVLQLNKLGVNDIIIDPGFGFGKTLEHNFQLLNQLELFHQFELPILVGVSRKSMINKVLGTKPENALNGTTALNTIALMRGAHILRVHDVKEAVEVKKLIMALGT